MGQTLLLTQKSTVIRANRRIYQLNQYVDFDVQAVIRILLSCICLDTEFIILTQTHHVSDHFGEVD